jgi:hypothetical protein
MWSAPISETNPSYQMTYIPCLFLTPRRVENYIELTISDVLFGVVHSNDSELLGSAQEKAAIVTCAG